MFVFCPDQIVPPANIPQAQKLLRQQTSVVLGYSRENTIAPLIACVDQAHVKTINHNSLPTTKRTGNESHITDTTDNENMVSPT